MKNEAIVLSNDLSNTLLCKLNNCCKLNDCCCNVDFDCGKTRFEFEYSCSESICWTFFRTSTSIPLWMSWQNFKNFSILFHISFSYSIQNSVKNWKKLKLPVYSYIWARQVLAWLNPSENHVLNSIQCLLCFVCFLRTNELLVALSVVKPVVIFGVMKNFFQYKGQNWRRSCVRVATCKYSMCNCGAVQQRTIMRIVLSSWNIWLCCIYE